MRNARRILGRREGWLCSSPVNRDAEDHVVPHTEHGDLSAKERRQLPNSGYAFPEQRKEPLTDASHVRNALARFDQVQDVSDEDRALAFQNISAAARHYEVEVDESDWCQLGKHPHTNNSAK